MKRGRLRRWSVAHGGALEWGQAGGLILDGWLGRLEQGEERGAAWDGGRALRRPAPAPRVGAGSLELREESACVLLQRRDGGSYDLLPPHRQASREGVATGEALNAASCGGATRVLPKLRAPT